MVDYSNNWYRAAHEDRKLREIYRERNDVEYGECDTHLYRGQNCVRSIKRVIHKKSRSRRDEWQREIYNSH